jgi:hypothetical protein
MRSYLFHLAALLTVAATAFAIPLHAQDTDPVTPDEEAKAAAAPSEIAQEGDEQSNEQSGGQQGGQQQAPKHAQVLKDAKPIDGMIRLYRRENNLFAELQGGDYSSEYIVLISIARGIGRGQLLGGMSWGFGDDWVWTFRKVDDKVHVIRKNVRFKAEKNTPEATAVKNAYTDSVLFSLPIAAKGPKGGDLVDLSPIFMSDLPQIGRYLSGFSFARDKSTWEAVKGFKDNIELTVAATYQSGGQAELDEVPDSRGVGINVHYSISRLPNTGYVPRLADDRVGYFLTAVKDYSKQDDRDYFVRYINRWQLQKPPGAGDGPTPPKEPIVFWIEKTVPFKYRKPIREGIEEWNKAFEAAGWLNAIEVRQQPDDAEWDPEDINYNTFRWITASAGFAMGPSRVNPHTGQILDADIIFDADFLKFWKEEFDTFTPQSVALMTGGVIDPDNPETADLARLMGAGGDNTSCMLSHGMPMQFALGSTALLARADASQVAELQEKLLMQGLKEVTMHELGHTLGLRHNFKASTMHTLKEANDPSKVGQPLVASVMDYSPVNVVPKEWQQGDYFSQTVGPYDIWAIQYGYTALSGGTKGEVAELQKIATRSGEPQLAYATDEDTIGIDPDPTSNRFDFGSDPLEYAQTRAQLLDELVPGLVDRMTQVGDDYVQARRAFNILLGQQGQSMYFASRYIGGLHTTRSHKGDKDARQPIELVDVNKQREALALIEKHVLGAEAYRFPPEMFNQFGNVNWNHWGVSGTSRKDFPLHDSILQFQSRILEQLLSPVTLERMHDMEAKVPADQDVLTTAELIERLNRAVFAEVDNVKEGEFTNRQPAISSLRRNLQRNFVVRMSNLAMGRTSAPDDCQTIAYAELSALAERINGLLGGPAKLDSYTRAHLTESRDRIRKVIDARLTLSGP